jgi:DNA mismatch repair protein MutL
MAVNENADDPRQDQSDCRHDDNSGICTGVQSAAARTEIRFAWCNSHGSGRYPPGRSDAILTLGGKELTTCHEPLILKTMNRIRLLSEQVANQIAAGEVVERPASVVKELVENALDAGSTRITLEVQAGGRSLIRVTDDGVGMGRDDALLCLERHATSKLQCADDLYAIRTMGFRGEAVPSIASVSRMILTSREREAQSGTQVTIHGGRIVEVKEAGSAPGTCVEVRQLFFNVPARRKFLRSEETERAHIQHYLSLAALAFPEVAFTYIDDKRVVWQLPQAKPSGTSEPDLAALRERLRGLYGAELEMLEVNFTTELEPVRQAGDEEDITPSTLRLWGFMGAPGVSRGSRDEQHLFVNRRPVENRGLNFALLEGYHTALMKGRYPVCCLFLEVDPASVDVNIHPTKREVKFRQEYQVRRAVTQAVRDVLLSFHAQRTGAPQSGARLSNAPVAPSAQPQAAKNEPSPSDPADQPVDFPAFPVHTRSGAWTTPPPAEPANQAAAVAAVSPEAANAQADQSTTDATVEAAPALAPPSMVTPPPSLPSADPVPLLQVPLRVLGVIGQLYVVLESDRGLVLLDQHAAHERILFEQMLRRVQQENAPSQRLLLPETIELSVRDSQFLREQLPSLSKLGVGLSEFGDRTFLLDGLPPFVKVPDARKFVIELVEELKAAGEGVNSWRLGEATVAKTVCRHAVKANDPLAQEELEHLVRDLRQCAMPYTCPHGRPTLIEMSFRDLEKKFGRVQ